MESNRRVYLLDPKTLSPETIAVAFAKTSRSPKSFQEIASELSDEDSSDFHEKWVVGYGHASVAEHAVLHIAIENVSRLAIECIESNRLASYTEKSTRYQKWSANSFCIPEELDTQPALYEKYKQACCMLFEAYQQAVPDVKKVVEEENPRGQDESLSAWDRRIRTDYVDVCRFLLPASSLANVGVTINGRALEHALQKMLSHRLIEVQKTGQQIKQVALQNVPTLVKYADAIPYLTGVEDNLKSYLSDLPAPDPDNESCRLIAYDPHGEEMVLAAALYRFGDASFQHYQNWVSSLESTEKKRLTALILEQRRQFDIPLRELEHMSFTFDLVLDQGAYFELKRHRMMTQTPQDLGVSLGYTLPARITLAGLKENFNSAMEQIQEAHAQISRYNPHLGAYLVPNAFNRRVLLTLNLRSAFHLCNLRTAPNAHFSIRRIAQQILDHIRQAAPLTAAYIHAASENWQQIETTYFDHI